MTPRAALAWLHRTARRLATVALFAGLPLATAAHEDMTKGFIDNMLGACTDPNAPFAERLSLLHGRRAPDEVDSRVLLDLLAEAYARGSALTGRVDSEKLEERKDGLKVRMTELLRETRTRE